jgi:hypothetical protein
MKTKKNLLIEALTEKIIEIINININVPCHLGTKICGQKAVAQEIATLVDKDFIEKEFVEWKDKNIGKTTTSSYWFKDKRFKTLDELYRYWLNLPENKEINI